MFACRLLLFFCCFFYLHASEIQRFISPKIYMQAGKVLMEREGVLCFTLFLSLIPFYFLSCIALFPFAWRLARSHSFTLVKSSRKDG